MRFEGCRLESYPDPGTGGEPWTIGWGATGADVRRGLKWTQKQCDERLLLDLRKFEAGVEAMVQRPISSNAFSALVVLAYNIGLGALRGSTLMRKINWGDMEGAAEEFTRWNRAGGKIMAGLTRRRIAERELFLRPDGA